MPENESPPADPIPVALSNEAGTPASSDGSHTGNHAGGHGGSHGAGHNFDFTALNKSHNYPYPAIEWIHGKPILLLNAPEYAAANYPLLNDSAKSVTTVKPGYEAWAASYMTKTGWKAEEGKASLAQVMTLADGNAKLGSMPQALSFFTHQTFWSTIALSLMALCMLVLFRRKADQYKPANRFQHIMESLVLFVRDEIVRPNIHHGDAWVPFIASLFIAILTCNLFGLVPIFGTATGNIGVTSSWALVTLILMLVMGMKMNGMVGFWGSIVPVKWSWSPPAMGLWLFMFANELLSLVSRPTILALRLFANMFAGHIVILVFVSLGFVAFSNDNTATVLSTSLGLFGWVMVVGLYALELLVSVIQAFIFTMLTAVFIGLCMHPEH